jgi:hypothetical protein
MMWQAQSSQTKIAIGTTLYLPEHTSPGIPPTPLHSGDSIVVEFPDNSRTSLEVLKAETGKALVKSSDGAVWQMTPHTLHDMPVSFVDPDVHSQNWVIRSLEPMGSGG